MEYTITVPSSEVAMPLLFVADAMATHKATLGGTVTYHKPTYNSANKSLCLTLLDEVRQKRLKICDRHGIEIQSVNNASELHEYFSTLEQLNDWGKGTHVFRRCDMQIYQGHVNRSDEGGNVQKGFYRGFIGDSSVTTTNNIEKKAKVKPLPQQLFQEKEILRVIGELGFIATEIPPWEAGKRGVKAQVRDELDFPTKVFDKAWDRLRAEKSIKE